MKNLSQRDWAIALTIGILAFFLGFAVKAILDSKREPITIENPLNEALKKRSDSLEAVLIQRNLQIANNDKGQFKHDSVMIVNNKQLKPLYAKIISLDDSLRDLYLDSIFKRSAVRR